MLVVLNELQMNKPYEKCVNPVGKLVENSNVNFPVYVVRPAFVPNIIRRTSMNIRVASYTSPPAIVATHKDAETILTVYKRPIMISICT